MYSFDTFFYLIKWLRDAKKLLLVVVPTVRALLVATLFLWKLNLP